MTGLMQKGVRIIGDLPIYVPYDSVDCWMFPELFQFDERRVGHVT